jgi:hypothetical protein
MMTAPGWRLSGMPHSDRSDDMLPEHDFFGGILGKYANGRANGALFGAERLAELRWVERGAAWLNCISTYVAGEVRGANCFLQV